MGTSEDGSHSVSHKVLTLRERQFLAKFYNSVNKFIPMTCHTVLRDAMNPLPLDVIDGVTASEVNLIFMMCGIRLAMFSLTGNKRASGERAVSYLAAGIRRVMCDVSDNNERG